MKTIISQLIGLALLSSHALAKPIEDAPTQGFLNVIELLSNRWNIAQSTIEYALDKPLTIEKFRQSAYEGKDYRFEIAFKRNTAYFNYYFNSSIGLFQQALSDHGVVLAYLATAADGTPVWNYTKPKGFNSDGREFSFKLFGCHKTTPDAFCTKKVTILQSMPFEDNRW